LGGLIFYKEGSVQVSRREFAKKAAMVAAGAVATSTALMASNSKPSQNSEVSSNGVVVGKSRKKEIIYTKTAAWEEFYKSAK
jgi:secreted PhoX family phosphatase